MRREGTSEVAPGAVERRLGEVIAFGGAYWPLATAHSDPLPPDDLSGLTTSRRRAVARAVDQEGRGGGVTSLPLPMHPCPGVTYQRQSFS